MQLSGSAKYMTASCRLLGSLCSFIDRLTVETIAQNSGRVKVIITLFYRDAGILILAYGISETSQPAHKWHDTDDAPTVRELLSSKFGKTPERYGDSLAFSAYRVPEDIEGSRLNTDLDRLITKYD